MVPKPAPIEEIKLLPTSIGIPEEGSLWPRLKSKPKKPKKAKNPKQ
jgi:hypothetical protein